MREHPVATITGFVIGFAITGLITYMHSKHIWPLNSILNESITAAICFALALLCRHGGRHE
jgi:hypothetical protein